MCRLRLLNVLNQVQSARVGGTLRDRYRLDPCILSILTNRLEVSHGPKHP